MGYCLLRLTDNFFSVTVNGFVKNYFPLFKKKNENSLLLSLRNVLG